MSLQKLEKVGEEAFKKLEKINSELFTMTYGSFVMQLLEDFEDPEEVNKQLDKIGFKLGQRLIDEYFSKSGNITKCKSFAETAEHVAKIGFKMFLGVNAKVLSKNGGTDTNSFVISFEENPLIDFVELPPKYREKLNYSNIICGVIRGCLDMIQMKVDCEYVKCPLKKEGDVSEIKVTLKEIVRETFKDDDKK